MSPFHLFDRVGVELEYMIVHRETLDVLPIADQLLYSVNGTYDSDVHRVPIAWSNELVNHVVELKTSPPAEYLGGLHQRFHEQVLDINNHLEAFNARLLPTGAHPWMDPNAQMKLWEHEYREIYHLYNRIFDCRGHGWANLQSMHLNLPFCGDHEFERLHACIRLLLPLIPAIAASTPVLEGKLTGYHSTRMRLYEQNQARFPIIAGHIIPEQIWNEKTYSEQVFQPIRTALRPYDTENILDSYFVNSRGAIARFDRGAIEIRIADLQESPRADLALASLFVSTLKTLNSERWTDLEFLKTFEAQKLKIILDRGITHGYGGIINDLDFLSVWGLKEKSMRFSELWQYIFSEIKSEMSRWTQLDVHQLVMRGDIAGLIIRDLKRGEALHNVYHQLAIMLDENLIYQ